MRRWIAVALIALIAFFVLFRQRIYLRDPLATVTRDGVRQRGISVLINYSNDILLDDLSAGERRNYLVQHWNGVAAQPAAALRCFQWVACLTDADQATATPIVAGSRGRREKFEGVTLTNRQVEFVDENGALVRVVLR